MADILAWLDYKWSFDFPVGMYRAICERLRGTPARLEDMLRGADRAALTRKPEGKWSVQEHVGHLLALEEGLHYPRFEQYLRGERELMAADMSNRATFEAHFNERAFADVLGEFRGVREKLMRLLDALTLDDAARVATHPRLKMPLRLVDLCYFGAQHDDHHLAVIRSLL